MMNKRPIRPKNAFGWRGLADFTVKPAENSASVYQRKSSFRDGRQVVNVCPVIFGLK
jgi:hypothetical protein